MLYVGLFMEETGNQRFVRSKILCLLVVSIIPMTDFFGF